MRNKYLKLNPVEQVRLFMDAFGIDKGNSKEMLRHHFINLVEEVAELGNELGLYNELNDILLNSITKIKNINDSVNVDSDYSKAAILDAIIDMRYFENQLLIANHIETSLDEGFAEVTQANMNKMIDGKILRSDGTDGKPKGKVLKPDGWKEPDLLKIVRRHNQDVD